MRGHWRRGAGHGRALDHAGVARADAGMAQREPARRARRGHRPAGANRELRARLCPRPGLADARGDRRDVGRSGLRQRVGRRRRRRDDSRRGLARPAQHRRRVRPRSVVARRPALFVRLERLLGGVRLQSRDARALLWPAGGAGAQERGPAPLHGRGLDRPRPRARRQGDGGPRHDGALPRSRIGVGHQRPRSGPCLCRRRNHAGLGSHRIDRA